MNLILIERGEVRDSGAVRLDDHRARHLREVLRVEVGQTVRIGVVDGATGKGRVTSIDALAVELDCHFDEFRPATPRVDLILAVPRPKVLKRLWAPLAALGVGKVALVNAARVERDYFDSHAVRAEHIRPRLLEGLAQARDTRVPEIRVERRLKVFVEDALETWADGAKRILLATDAPRALLGVARRIDERRRVVIAIGPEGGWTPYERDLFARHGFVTAGLGPRILRTDTATVAALALVHEAIRPDGR